MSGIVYLVGAGPGDPRLLTVKAAELIASADVVVLDALVSPAIRRLIPPATRIVEAGKRASRHTLSQEEINHLLVELASDGSRVVRLKGGDPFVFGRGGEEAEELSSHGVRFEIVPGISSSIAGPAYAGIPVTHRTAATSVTLVTGHESDESSGVQWETLARSGGTLVFLMGLSRLPSIVENLQRHGMDRSTPAAVISKATTPQQHTATGTLETITAASNGLPPPALIVVGPVVNLHQTISWFETRPLFGRKVVVTRAREQASELTRLLEDAGAEVLEYPMIEIAAPESWDSLDAVVASPAQYQWLIFTSANGVSAFFERLFAAGLDARKLATCQIAAVGASTAETLRHFGVVPDVVPDKFLSAALLPLLPEQQSGVRTAVIRAASGREELIDGLRARGGSVDLAVAYRTIPSTHRSEELKQFLLGGEIDCVTFTSSSTVTNFLEGLGEGEKEALSRVMLASIGAVTSATLRQAGLRPDIEAASSSVESLAEAVRDYFTTGAGAKGVNDELSA